MPVRRYSFVAAICVTALLWRPAAVCAATPAEVDAAIKKGVAHLYSLQKNGNWEAVKGPQKNAQGEIEHGQNGHQWGGLSSMALCAMLYARESPQDPRIRAGVEWLTNADVRGTYALGFRCQVWQMAPNLPNVRKAAQYDARTLWGNVYKDPKLAQYGKFSYYYDNVNGVNVPAGHYDHSVSQYGVLAMWALQQMGVEFPGEFWKMTEEAWRNQQYDDGGWQYIYTPNDPKPSFTITGAGLATLFITQDYLHAMEGINCKGNIVDPHIERGMQWMAKNFNRYTESPFYGLYGVERIGVASGYKYFGDVDWYKLGAEFFVRGQQPNGSWGGIPETSWALMFLIRGRAPVMMNKLEYTTDTRGDKPKPGTWNQRPREVANVTRWVSKQMEKDLNWQIVNLKAAKPADLHDSQILWISGSEPLRFSEADEAKLKEFIEQGGIVLGHADCGMTSFASSFRKLGQKMFPYEFRPLPESHAIYTRQQYHRSNWKRNVPIEGMSNGARELMLLIPNADPGKGWQTGAFSGPDREPQAQMLANIFLYSVDKKNLRSKGETYIVVPDGKPATASIKVARLEYAGNWNPEPAGWKRLAAVMHNARSTDLAVETVKLGSGKLSNAYAVAHLTGIGKTTLTAAAREEIKKFVEGGGTLVIDAASGNGDFGLAAQTEVTNIFPAAAAPQPLKADHPVYSTGDKLTTFDYRQFAQRTLGNIRTPRLQGVDIGGKTRIFISMEDMSVGLVGQPVDGIFGYDPATATSLMGNILQFAAKK